MGDTYNRMVISVSDTEKLSSLWDHGQLIFILSRTRIVKNTIFVGPKNETIIGLKLLLNQRTQWYDYIEEVMKITNVNPNNNSEYSASLNQSSFPFGICDISLPQDKTGSAYFLMSQNDTSYVHIGSTLCLITTLRKYNADGYASGTDITMHLRPFVLITYICVFRKDKKMIEHTKDQWIDQKHHDVLQWAINAKILFVMTMN